MKAIRVRQFGDPEVMQVEDVPDLTPGAGQVLVRLAPRLAVEGLATPVEPAAHGRSLLHARVVVQFQNDSLPAGAAQSIHRSAIRPSLIS